MCRTFFILLLTALMLSIVPVSAQTVTTGSTVGQIYTSEFTVNARADTVMMRLGNPDSLVKIMGFEYQGGAKRLAQVGDAFKVIPQKDRYNDRDTGVIGLTFLQMRVELRLTFEPANGSYYFQDQWKFFSSAGNETRIIFTERYFEPSSQSSTQLDEQARLIKEGLARLKTMVDRR
ncbi:MAG: hypothetical protein WBM07_11900 [Chitinivibrionales bacterium]